MFTVLFTEHATGEALGTCWTTVVRSTTCVVVAGALGVLGVAGAAVSGRLMMV
jgi:hypothetical protein